VAGQPTPSTDLYALGATLFELIAGRPPFVGSTDEIIDHHLLDAAPTVSAVSGLPVPPEVERIVAALLAKKPQDRPADARAAARVLRNCIAGLGGRRVRHTPRPFVMRAQYSEAIVDGLPLGLFVANAAGVVLFANPMLPRLLGENLGETRLGDSLLATIFPGIEHEARAVILRGRAIRRTGTTSHGRTLQLILSPHRRDGEVVGVCGVIDVTATQPK
jgi:PAS domain-containing protein